MRQVTKKLHILLLSFIFSPNIGGVESHLDDLCSDLAKKGYQITVITYQPLLAKVNASSYEKKDHFEIYRIPWIKFNLFNRLEKLPILQMVYLVPAIFLYTSNYLIKKHKDIDVIQTHGFNMAIVGFLLSSIFHIPFTVNTHVSFYFNKSSLYAKVLTYILNKARFVLVLTKESQGQLRKIGVKNEKILVYHQWIDTKLFIPKDRKVVRKRYHIPESTFIVLFTGRLIPAKGIPLILEAAQKVKKNILFVIVGSGEMKDVIAEKEKNLATLRFIGQVKREELPLLYSAADICLFPSLQATTTYAEGIPRVMIEALSCGTPLIATKTGGVSEVINKNVGFFVAPDSNEIVQLVEYLSNKRSMLQNMRKTCITYALKEFDRQKNADIIEKSFI